MKMQHTVSDCPNCHHVHEQLFFDDLHGEHDFEREKEWRFVSLCPVTQGRIFMRTETFYALAEDVEE